MIIVPVIIVLLKDRVTEIQQPFQNCNSKCNGHQNKFKMFICISAPDGENDSQTQTIVLKKAGIFFRFLDKLFQLDCNTSTFLMDSRYSM